jgi:Putative zinc-finger
MTEVPKIVHERLRAASRTQGHPDADQLTAFVEQALAAHEREDVLAHLAVCGDCRELVALSLPALEPVAVPNAEVSGAPAYEEEKKKKSWLSIPLLSWPNLRWAGLAAGVVVVASVLLVRPGKQDGATQSLINPQKATIATTNSARPLTVSPSPAPTTQAATLASNDAKELRGARPSSSLPLSKKLKAPTPMAPPAAEMTVPAMDMAVVEAKPGARSPLQSNNSPSGAAGAGIGQTNEVVEVTAESPRVQSESSSLPVTGVAAQKDAPAVEKAKPALETETNQLQDAISTNTVKELPLQGRNFTALTQSNGANQALARSLTITWTIAGGVLQRSFDSGQTWQNSLRADHPLLCYKTRGSDVWTGGQAGTLYHSRDDGGTWTKVQPAIKSQALTSDLTSIELPGEDNHTTRIVITTSSLEIWSSVDGGKSWDKK